MLVWFLKKSKDFKYLKSLALLLLVIVSLVLIKILNFAVSKPFHLQQKITVVEIDPGMSLTRFANQLHQWGLLSSTDRKWLIRLAYIARYARHLQVGEYIITASTTPWQLLKMLNDGAVIQYKITFPEGITFKEMLSILHSQPKITHSLVGLSLAQIRQQLNITTLHIEGMFYPSTYFFRKGTSDRQILQQALRQMQRVIDEEWQNRSSSQPYANAYEALIAASLVEKETANDKERYLIASVIANRLHSKMLLQIDPAVIYGMGGHFLGRLLRSDLKFESPYNTYLYPGLPPSPIALASQKSIHAVLHPAMTNYLYYVSNKDGTHLFATNLKEHVENINTVKNQNLLDTKHD